MKAEFKPLFQSFTFNNGVVAKNRLVVAPMTHWASDDHGHATQAELDYIRVRAKGFGIFVTASTAVSWQGRGFVGEPNAISAADLASLKQVASTIQSQGALAIMQLHHAGKMAEPAAMNGAEKVAPSAQDGARAMTEAEIAQTIDDYRNTAVLALQAGFDGVELHGANGYLLQQFSSAKSNQRTDGWGGSLEHRLRFPLAVTEAVLSVKAEFQRDDFIVGYRLTPEEAGDHGLTMHDSLVLGEALAARGVQYVHLSLQDFYSKARRGADSSRSRMALMLERLAGKTALIGVGKLATPKKALDAFNTGWTDFVAIGLGVLANPNFAELIETGKDERALKMFKLSRGAAYHQIPQPMWDKIMTFVPKPVVAVTKWWGKLWGWQ